jgi:uncharacterized repeat protein (TIGR03803 family)
MRRMVFLLFAVMGLAMVTVAPGQSRAANLMPLYSFCALPNCADGGHPIAALLADANGNLFGTTFVGGTNGGGTVFEIPKTDGGYATTPTILVSFCALPKCADGANPAGALIADANGNLFGTTVNGGANNAFGNGGGTVFEIAKTRSGYATTPTTLVSFCALPNCADGLNPGAALILDANGNLFGTTIEGGSNAVNPGGTVFEIPKTYRGYATTPTTLVSFCALPNCADGSSPQAALILDANGNLFGTTAFGGANVGDSNPGGTVFEIPKTHRGYATTPTILVNFNFADGAEPQAALILDAYGNLFGTTASGGANVGGTVFEIPKTHRGYATTPTILVNFNGADGAGPHAALIADGNGNLFGTTASGGASESGTVFEIPKTHRGYATTPTILVNFNDGDQPEAALIADGNGNLLGTTALGGANLEGTVFEITDSGFVVPPKFAGMPGKPNCIGKSISAMARQYGGLNNAAAVLGYPSVQALQKAVLEFCEG